MQPMPAKKAAKAPHIGPQHVSFATVPAKAGEGRVSVYDLKRGMPMVVDSPSPEVMKGMKWILVHFPTRRWVMLKHEKEWRDALKEIKAGNNPHKILPEKKVQNKTSKARACAGASPGPVQKTGPKSDATPPKDEVKKKVVIDPNMTFDQAMQHAFPVSRIMGEFERLLEAEEPIVDRETGKISGYRPVYATQFQALKSLTEWHQGRPGEKEKPPAEKKRLSHDELIAWLEGNEDAVEYMEEVIKRAKIKQAQKTTPPSAAPTKVS